MYRVAGRVWSFPITYINRVKRAHEIEPARLVLYVNVFIRLLSKNEALSGYDSESQKTCTLQIA